MAPPPKSEEQKALDRALGVVLRERREALGLSVVDVAAATVVTGSEKSLASDHLYRLEQGKNTAQPSTLKALAKALRTTPEVLRARAAELAAARNGRRNGMRNGNGGQRK